MLLSRLRYRFKAYFSSDSTLDEKVSKLHTAVRSKNYEDIDKLSCLINTPDVFGNTALHVAVMSRDLNLIKYLLEKGADPNRKNTSGVSPLHLIFRYNKKNLIRLFVDSATLDQQSILIVLQNFNSFIFEYKNLTHLLLPFLGNSARPRELIDILFPSNNYPNLNHFFGKQFAKKKRWKSIKHLTVLSYVSKLTSSELKMLDQIFSHLSLNEQKKFLVFVVCSAKGGFFKNPSEFLRSALRKKDFSFNPLVDLLFGDAHTFKDILFQFPECERYKVLSFLTVFNIYPQYLDLFKEAVYSYFSGHYHEFRYRGVFDVPDELKKKWIKNHSKKVGDFEFSFTDDLIDLFNMGCSKHIYTCISYDSDNPNKISLVGSMANPWTKIFQLKDEEGELVVRAKAFLFIANGKPVVVVDLFYGDKKYFSLFKQQILDLGFPVSFVSVSNIKLPSPLRAPIYADYAFPAGNLIL